MATFTFRIPEVLASRLNSAQMRSWLADFVRFPKPLPPDPGSGDQRISLTLPEELVRNASQYLRCSPSEALRRIAVQQLGLFTVSLSTSPAAAGSHSDRFPSRKAGGPLPDEWISVPITGASVIPLVIVFLPLIVFLAWMFFTQRRNMTRKRT